MFEIRRLEENRIIITNLNFYFLVFLLLLDISWGVIIDFLKITSFKSILIKCNPM